MTIGNDVKEKILNLLRDVYYDYFYTEAKINASKRPSEFDFRQKLLHDGICSGVIMAASIVGIPAEIINSITEEMEELAKYDYEREMEEDDSGL